jgi:hypothetical protein
MTSTTPLPRRRFLSYAAGAAAIPLLPPAGSSASRLGVAHDLRATDVRATDVRANDVRANDVRVSHDTYAEHAEPNVAVNPRNPANLLAACMVNPTGQTMLVSYASFDRGQTWSSNPPLSLPGDTVWGDDVTVTFDPSGRGLICAMVTSGASRDDRNVYVWPTRDGGRSFLPPVPVMQHQFADHPWLAADPVRPGAIHAAWVAQDHAALGLGRSRDGGRSFLPPVALAEPDGVSVPAIACRGGNVHVCYEGGAVGQDPEDNTAPAATGGDFLAQVRVRSSTNGGHSFTDPVELGVEASELVLPGGVLIPNGPSVAVGPRAAYVAFVTRQPGSDHSEVLLTASPDGGRTWSEPVAVTPLDGQVYFQPQLAVDGRGRLGVFAFALAGGLVRAVLFVSAPHRLSFGAPRSLGAVPFDPAAGPGGGKHGAWWIGDYQGLAAGPTTFHPLWNDGRTGQLELFTTTVR